MTYQSFIEREATRMGSDGCSLVSEIYHWCCLEHDCAYRTHKDPHDAYCWYLNGVLNYWAAAKSITKSEADARFRKAMQERSKLGRFSPVSWLRWVGVKVGAKKAWKKGGTYAGVALP